MKLTHGKLTRALYLILFTASAITSLFQFHTNAVKIAGLSLLGFIVFDIVCFLRDKAKQSELQSLKPEVDKLVARNAELEAKFNTVVNDAGLAKIGSMIKR